MDEFRAIYMKKMIFVCVALVVMAGIARIYMAGGLSGILGDGTVSNDIRLKAPKNIQAVSTDQDVDVYKWRDEKGVMHFGEKPPEMQSNVEKMELRTNVNVMQSVAVNKEEPEEVMDSAPVSMANPYSPQGVADMMKQANQLKDTLNKQTENRQKMLDNMGQY